MHVQLHKKAVENQLNLQALKCSNVKLTEENKLKLFLNLNRS